MQNYTDQQLIKNYLKGDDKALDLLVKRYLKPIYRFVYGYSQTSQNAEDITQETFLKVWKNIKKYDNKKSFKVWVYTIAKNTALDYLKKKNPVLFSQFEKQDGKNTFIENIKDLADLPDVIAEKKNIKDMLGFAIKSLSENYQSVLTLYYTENMNFREIAETLGESINTIKIRHRRGLILLKHGLNNNFYFPIFNF
jgi:RNA polymerase sigma-70 factor (ECF subfamily)